MSLNLKSGDPLLDATATELSKLVRAKDISPVELMERTLARVEILQEKLNAFITIISEIAIDQAKQAEIDIRNEVGQYEYRKTYDHRN